LGGNGNNKYKGVAKGAPSGKGNTKPGFNTKKSKGKGKSKDNTITCSVVNTPITSLSIVNTPITLPTSQCICLNSWSGKLHTNELYELTEIANRVTMGEIPDTIITQIQSDTSHIKFNTLLDTGALQGN
jgi:hypothetical protein